MAAHPNEARDRVRGKIAGREIAEHFQGASGKQAGDQDRKIVDGTESYSLPQHVSIGVSIPLPARK